MRGEVGRRCMVKESDLTRDFNIATVFESLQNLETLSEIQ